MEILMSLGLTSTPRTTPLLPAPRGPLTELVCDRLQRPPRSTHWGNLATWTPLADDDIQLALHICYGLHYDSFADVDDRWEWEPSLLALRARLEEAFLAGLDLRAHARGVDPQGRLSGRQLLQQIRALLTREDGPSLSGYMATRGSLDQLREFVIHRSIYQRKEADPHTWAIPRLRGRAKSAMVTLQMDEYGAGKPGRSHAELFANTMRTLDLDPAPGAYTDQVPAVTLATDNLVSLLGLHRRWRGALVGHLAAFEMTSVVPMSNYAKAVHRLLGPGRAAEFYDVHVEADVIHERIAADDLMMGFAESDPEAAADVTFGIAALLEVEARFRNHLLGSWAENESSLYPATVGEVHPADTKQSHLRVLCLEEPHLGELAGRAASLPMGASWPEVPASK
jgi:hypothetical protein